MLENYELVQKGFRVLHPLMAGYIGQEFSRVYKNDWWQEILDALLEICKEPLHFELILKQVFERFALTMDYSQYVLIGSTIRSYLSYLVDQEKVECYVEDALLLWKTTE